MAPLKNTRNLLIFALIVAFPMQVLSMDKIAVMELKAKSGIKQAQMDVLSDMLATQIRNLGGYEVVTRSDIESMLGLEKAKEFIGCDDASCLAEIGGVLGVQYLVTGNVALFGGVYAINLKIIDIKHAKVKNSIFRKVTGGEAALLDAVPLAVSSLMGRKPSLPGQQGNQGRHPQTPMPPPRNRSPRDDTNAMSSAIPASGDLGPRDLEGRYMFLRYNLRFQHGGKASCVNYLTGKMIPAGTRIKILKVTNKEITFMTSEGQKIRLRFVQKWAGKKAAQWIQTVMSQNDPRTEWSDFTSLERQGISQGKAIVGMRKKAVLVALGWPPAHRTKSLDSNRWTYWRTRFGTIVVHFENGRVSSIGGR
ncbi:MAG: hypothetical protein GXP49_16425 [Deltaproteobacteria bacterium]|nr:hypothetical protein [Deltaproteobacteria bacterium]